MREYSPYRQRMRSDAEEDYSMKLDEIRINPRFSAHCISEFDNNEEGDSTPVINKRIMRTGELIRKFKSAMPKNDPTEIKMDHLFPPNCRYYEKLPNSHVVVIEEPPAYRTINVDKDMSTEYENLKSLGRIEEYGLENWKEENPTKPYKFTLALPYAVFILAFSNEWEALGGYIFARTQPISGFADLVCKVPFLNISDNQSICFGEDLYRGPKRSIFSDTNHVVSSFWSSIFNTDYIYNYVAYQDTPFLCDYFSWQHYSEQDPMFVYTTDWIKADYNLGEYIQKAREWNRGNDGGRDRLDFSGITELFNSQDQRDLEDVPGFGGEVREPLIYDISQYIFIGDFITLNVGDSFEVKGKRLYVDSFLGFRKMADPIYISLYDDDLNLYKWKLTNEVKKLIEVKITAERFEQEAPMESGDVIHAGDIVVMKNTYGNDIYRKVHYMRKNTLGQIEGRMGSDYYIIDNLPEDTRTFSTEEPEYNGIVLNNKDKYIVHRSSSVPDGPHFSIAICKFKHLTTGSRNNLILKFVECEGDNEGYEYEIPYKGESTHSRIYEMNENLRPMPELFRIGKKIVWSRRGSRMTPETGRAFAIPGVGIATPYGSSIRSPSGSQFSDFNFVNDDTFKLESWDMDLEFSIGDKVVVTNWDDPLTMLTIRTIVGFVDEDDEYGGLSFALMDKNENATKHLYVDYRRRKVNIGSIRKITNKIGDLEAGMKIKANESGISMFPKKDTNIIIGFLYDTGGEPLVLCSNLCTLWYSDVISKFDITKMSDPKWAEIEHAPLNVSKMRYQAGDILMGGYHYDSSFGYMAFRPIESKTIRAHALSYLSSSHEDSYSFDRSFTRDVKFECFPNPRMTGRQEGELGFINAFPNFHGMYTATSRYGSRHLFANDPRSLLNVPDSSE